MNINHSIVHLYSILTLCLKIILIYFNRIIIKKKMYSIIFFSNYSNNLYMFENYYNNYYLNKILILPILADSRKK